MYDDKLGLRNDALVTIGEVHLLRHDFDSAKDQFEKCLSLKNDRDMIIAYGIFNTRYSVLVV